MIKFVSARHAFPENKLCIDRKAGRNDYTFLHFYQSVQIMYKGELITTKPNAVIIYNIKTPQYFKIDTPLVHNWAHIVGDAESVLEQNKLKTDTIYYPENVGFITDLFYEIETELYGDRENKTELLNLKFNELIIKLSRSINGQGSPEFSLYTRHKFNELRNKMFLNLSESWSVEKMAYYVGFSQSRFYNLYKTIYGITPTADLINAKISAAKNMLSFEKKSIEQISVMLGYQNIEHFIRQFKAKTGYTPSAYRKKH